MDREQVEILINVRQQGRENFTEAQAGLDLLRRAIEAVSRAQRDGEPGIAAYRAGLKSIRNNAIEAGLGSEALKEATNQARTALQAYFAAIAGGLPIEAAQSAALAEVSGQFEANAAASETSTAANDAGTATVWAAIPAWVGWGIAIVGATLAMWPFIAAVGTAAVAAVGFVVAGTGALLLLGGLVIGFGGLTAVLALVSSHTITWTRTIADLKSKIEPIIEALGKQLRPEIIEVSKFIQSLLPIVQQVGSQLISWFGSQLPAVLRGLSGVIKDLLPDFRTFADFLGRAFQQAGPVIKQTFEIMTRIGIGAIEGLVTNLTRLANWFNTESPKWQPIWDAIGNVIQFVAGIWAQFNDWIVANWPATMAQVQEFIANVQDGWDKWGPMLTTIIGLVTQFIQIGMQAMIDHADILVPAMLGLALAFLGVVAAISILVGALVTAASATANFLTTSHDQFVVWANGIIDAINAVIAGLDRIPGVNISPVAHLDLWSTSGTAAAPTAGANSEARKRLLGANNVTINVNGAQSPQSTAHAVSRKLRTVTQQ